MLSVVLYGALGRRHRRRYMVVQAIRILLRWDV